MILLDLLAALFVRILSLIFHVLPISLTLVLGRFIGCVVFHCGAPRGQVAYSNMRAAFCRTKDPEELRRIVKDTYKSFAEMALELLSMPKVDAAYMKKYITIENFECLSEARAKNKGIILLTAHFGSWELSSVISSFKGLPLVVLAREQKMKHLNGLLNKLRESKGAIVVSKGITTRYIIRSLREGKLIGMVADQSGGPSGVMVNFFGRPASTSIGAYRFADKTGATIIPVFIVRTRGPYHTITLENTFEVGAGADPAIYAQKYNDLLEKYVTRHYDHWLWFHKRWKQCPLKNIVILSDGKQGHLNQSQALANYFMKYRRDKGVPDTNTSVQVIEVKFKNQLSKRLLNLAAMFIPKSSIGCGRYLKYFLQKDSYEKLIRTFADVVISSGSAMPGVNYIYSAENGAKNAVAMKPGVLRWAKFDLVVLPRHDLKSKNLRENVVVTDVAPNLIDAEYLAGGRDRLVEHIGAVTKKVVGVLIGGDNQNTSYTIEGVEKVLDQVLAGARESGAEILVTTSRRTARGIEELVKNKMRSSPLARFVVIANENNPSFAMAGILGSSDVLVVSGESVSMVSEAVTSGKKVIVWPGKRLSDRKTKHDRFLDILSERGIVSFADGSRSISDMIGDAIAAGRPAGDLSGSLDFVLKNMWRLGA